MVEARPKRPTIQKMEAGQSLNLSVSVSDVSGQYLARLPFHKSIPGRFWPQKENIGIKLITVN